MLKQTEGKLHRKHRALARRGGVVSATLGIVLSVVISAILMQGALARSAQTHHRDIAALLVASCQAGVALDDKELVQDTLDELSPQLDDLLAVKVRESTGSVIAQWARGAYDADVTTTKRMDIAGRAKASVGSIEVVFSVERDRQSLVRLWMLLGLLGAASLGVSFVASHLLGRELDEKSRLEGELDVAERIQMSLLPDALELGRAEVAAQMLPASEVGGDYYDVIPTASGGWICVGDVVGHGLPAGMLMLMMQSSLATLLRGDQGITPRHAFRALNRAVFDNVQHRMGTDQYATLQLVRYEVGGTLTFAGGHLDFVSSAPDDAEATLVPSPGPFVALEEEIEERDIEQSTLNLVPGQVLLFYTDGVTEARNARGELFGCDRLRRIVHESRHRPADEIVAQVVASARSWGPQRDDITVVALRYLG